MRSGCFRVFVGCCSRDFIEGSAVTLEGRGLAGEILPALDGHIHIGRVELDRMDRTAGHFAGNDALGRVSLKTDPTTPRPQPPITGSR